MIFANANTLSFYQVTDIDYVSTWSNPFNSPSYRYSPNVYSMKYYQPFVTGQTVKFQVIEDVQPLVYAVNKTTSTRVQLTGTNVSPIGWTGTAVWEFEYIFSEIGTYYFWISDGNNLRVNSEYICVTNNNKNVIDIIYSNSKNDYGMIFTQDDINFNTFNILANGRWSYNTGNEVESLTNDEGNVITLDAVPVDNYYLELSPISDYMEKKLNNIFSCDFLMINGIKCQLVDAIEVEKMSESNMKQLTVTLRIDADQNSLTGYKTVITDGNTYIIDNYEVFISD